MAAMIVSVGVATAQDYADIRLPNKLIARIRTGGPHGSIAQREAEIYQRITEALSDELDNIFDEEAGEPDLDVYRVDGVWTLSIGDQILIQAFEEDAAGAGTSTQELIWQWKANYAQQLPRAVSPIKVPDWWKQAHPGQVSTGEKRMHDLPAHDAVLVREVVEMLDTARAMSDERFEALLPAMQRTMLQRVWTYRHPQCGVPPLEEHIRAKAVLKRAHGLNDQQYGYEKWWLAGETIKKLRDAMDVPEGVGPVPEQRELPDFEAPSEPVTASTVSAPSTSVERPAVGTGIEPPTIEPGMPIQIAAMGTGLGEGAHVLNMGQQFEAPVDQLLVYVQMADAPPSTVLGVILHGAKGIMAQRRIVLSGDRRLGITFTAGPMESFEAGECTCRLTINGADAGRIPFCIEGEAGTIIEE